MYFSLLRLEANRLKRSQVYIEHTIFIYLDMVNSFLEMYIWWTQNDNVYRGHKIDIKYTYTLNHKIDIKYMYFSLLRLEANRLKRSQMYIEHTIFIFLEMVNSFLEMYIWMMMSMDQLIYKLISTVIHKIIKSISNNFTSAC